MWLATLLLEDDGFFYKINSNSIYLVLKCPQKEAFILDLLCVIITKLCLSSLLFILNIRSMILTIERFAGGNTHHQCTFVIRAIYFTVLYIFHQLWIIEKFFTRRFFLTALIYLKDNHFSKDLKQSINLLLKGNVIGFKINIYWKAFEKVPTTKGPTKR